MNILIVEDEESIRRRLERMVRSILGKNLSSLHTADQLPEAKEIGLNQNIDIVFLDLNLNNENGFELLSEWVSGSFQTIVVSAYTDRALEAFENGVIDFVPKPFTEERLNTALQRAQGILRENQPFARYLAVRVLDQIELVPLQEITCIEADGPYSTLLLDDGSRKMHLKLLKDLEWILPPNFMRVHKSHIANIEKATSIEGIRNYQHRLVFRNGHQIPISRNRYKEIKDQLG